MEILSAAEFVRLRGSEDPSEQERATKGFASDAVWLDVIAQDPDMRFWVAQNKTVSLAVLGVLAVDPDPRVRSMVASKRKLDSALFDLLAGDPDEGIRAAVARNPKVPRALLQQLAEDPSPFVRDVASEKL
jgi:hypothetical protein